MLLRNIFYFLAGIAFLFLARMKNLLKGYSTPKPFDTSETDRCIDYDFSVVDRWLEHLEKYIGEKSFQEGREVLELGPGSDLGIGLYLLSKGCKRYSACDVNDLNSSTPASFYERLFERLVESGSTTIADLREQLKKLKQGAPQGLNYVVRDDFDLDKAFGEKVVDIVFSQAAFEHFDDIGKTVKQLSSVCRPGAIIVAEIDLMTHSRWIRQKDPNNIYRYPDALYRLFHFRGIPNRIRPCQYQQAFEEAGWQEVRITPMIRNETSVDSYSGMSGRFRDRKNQMEYYAVLICARNGGEV